MCQNLAFSFALYSGQMCTAPQNVYLPADGIDTDEGHKSVAEVGAGIAAALDKLLGDDARAVELLGGSSTRRARAARVGPPRGGRAGRVASGHAPVVRRCDGAHAHAGRLTAADRSVYESECFGPVAYLIATVGTDESIDLFRDTVQRHGAMTASVYSTSTTRCSTPCATRRSRRASPCRRTCSAAVFVNQSAAFSDFHGTGANPAANASYTDGAYVASRFRVVQSRRHI